MIQQEMQVVADEEDNLSEFSKSDLASMTATSTSIIDEASMVSPNLSPDEIIEQANNSSDSHSDNSSTMSTNAYDNAET